MVLMDKFSSVSEPSESSGSFGPKLRSAFMFTNANVCGLYVVPSIESNTYI